jgi:hypothetical protein
MNILPPRDPTPRVLIVENERGTISNLTFKLERDVPDVVVESAENVADGRAKLDQSFVQKREIDVVILDLRLPKDRNDARETPDYTLGFLPGDDTLIIHVTAKPDEPGFAQVRPAPGTREAGRRLYIGKTDPEKWSQDVADAAAKYISEKQGRRLHAEFERLFRCKSSDAEPLSVARKRGPQSDRARGREIATFCDDAGDHWEHLDEQFRQELADGLGHVQGPDGRHFVGVVAAPESTKNNDA